MEDFSPIIAGIVRDCLQFEAASRPTANDVAERLVRWQFRDMDLHRDERGNTLLHQLAESMESGYSAYDKVRELLSSQKPAMVNAVNYLGETPLMLAKDKPLFISSALLRYRKVPFTNEEPSRIAECFHNIDLFGTLLKLAEKQDVQRISQIGKHLADARSFWRGALAESGSSNGETPFHIAAKLGNLALFDALVDFQVIKLWKTNNEGRTALHVATLHGHTFVMRKLIALTDASEEKNDVQVQILNTQDKAGKTALHLAAANGDLSALTILLNCRATNVNLRDFQERPPMFDITLAVSDDGSYQADVLKAFVHHPDIDLHAKDSTGETMLHKVARYDLAESAEILLKLSSTDMFVRENEHKLTPTHLSVREKSFSVANILLSQWSMNINKTDKYGNSLVHMLAAASISLPDAPNEEILMKRNAMMSFAETLVSRDDVDLNLRNSRGDTPLHIAIVQNNVAVVEAILSAPGGKLRINQCNKELRTPLLLATKRGKVEMAKMLLSRGDVDVHAADTHQRTPLHYASVKNAAEVATMILSRDDVNVNARDKNQRTPLHSACCYNGTEVSEILLSRDDVDVNARDKYQQTPLHVASWHKFAEVVRALLSRDDLDVNALDSGQQIPLHYASRRNAAELAKMLLSRDDVDVNAQDEHHQTPLHLASMENDAAEAAKILLSRDKINVNARDAGQQTPLHRASMNNAAKVAKLLLSRDDVDVNARDAGQQTPLHLTSMRDTAKVTKILLLRDEVNVNARDKDQRTPLHIASMRDAAKVTKILLLRDEVNVNARDKDMRTPLHIASMWDAAKVTKILLLRDEVNVNARDKDQRTPLHIASTKNAAEVASVLLSRDDVDVNSRDSNDLTPLEVAIECRSLSCFALLYNININTPK